jgi:hypothetical protein
VLLPALAPPGLPTEGPSRLLEPTHCAVGNKCGEGTRCGVRGKPGATKGCCARGERGMERTGSTEMRRIEHRGAGA